ncbi:MAG: hypothetical protein [Bacteriophage sp.]|nr:MAG: hypothetical protein [Bacteriophage sp.]
MARQLTTAEIKANQAVKKAQSAVKKSQSAYNKAKKKVTQYKQSGNKKLTKKWTAKKKSSKSKLDRDKKKLKSAQSKATKVKNDAIGAENLAIIEREIEEHNASDVNEGHGAIYQSDGSSTEIIYIAPTESETEDTSSNITTYEVDEGAPRKNYARVASKTVTVSGIITGETRAEADAKVYQLRVWHSRHYELTYKGNIFYKHLLLSDVSISHKDKVDNIDISLTFTFAYTAEVTTESSKKSAKKKKSKSTKTTSGNRSSTYTTVTIKAGDTLWGFSQKYGKSVAWLQKVNHIKGTTIYAGNKIRVR